MMLRPCLGDLPKFLELTFLISKNYNNNCKQALVIFCGVTMLCICAASTLFLGVEKSLEGSAYFVVIGIITFSQIVILFFNKKKVWELLEIIKMFQDRHEEDWEKETFQSGSTEIWNVIFKYCLIIISYAVFYHTLPFIVDLLLGNIFPDFPCVTVQLPFQAIIDLFEPRSLMSFVIAFPAQVWSCLAILIHSGTETFILVSIMYTKIELKIIRLKLLIVKDVLNNKENNFLNVAEKILNRAIIQHQLALKGLCILKDTLGLPIAIQSTGISICYCFNFYCIITFDDKVNLSAKFNGIFSVVCLGFLLLCLCYFGESLETENTELYNTVYDLPWYDEDVKFRKKLMMMLRQAEKPFVINYHHQANLNLHTFMQIVNTSYSYLMVLRSTV